MFARFCRCLVGFWLSGFGGFGGLRFIRKTARVEGFGSFAKLKGLDFAWDL